MIEEPIRVNSESWTGKMPDAAPIRSAEYGRSKALAAFAMIGSLTLWAPWEIYKGYFGVGIVVPLQEEERVFTKADGPLFDYAVFQCVLLFMLGLFFIGLLVRVVRQSIDDRRPPI